MTWNDYYTLAEKYYRRHGNLVTPSTCWCMGENLGAWLSRQRVCHLPDAPHPLTSQQVELLDALNMDWKICRRDWEVCFGYAERYYAKHGNLNVTPGLIVGGANTKGDTDSIDGTDDLCGEESNERNECGESIELNESYESNEGSVQNETNGRNETNEDMKSFNLYNWLLKQRQRYSIYNSGMYTEEEISARKKTGKPLTEEQISRLESIGMNWNPYDNAWERAFAIAERYYKEHGNLTVPKHYEIDGVNLSHWIWAQRRTMLGTDPDRKHRLTEEQVRRLESIGMEWSPKSKGFGYYYDQAKKFYDAYGHTDFPAGALYIEGERLPENGESLLEWKQEQEQNLLDYIEKKDTENITDNCTVKRETKNAEQPGQRSFENANRRVRGTFNTHRKLLYEIGINPTNWEIPWEKNYRHAKAYFQTYGNLLVPFYYKTEDGVALGKWISEQRLKKKRTKGTLSADQIERLEKIGMVWDTGGKRSKRRDASAAKNVKDIGTAKDVETAKVLRTANNVKKDKVKISTAWERSFAVAEAYYKEHGNLFVPTDYVSDGVKLNYWLRTQRKIRFGKMKNRKSPLTDEQIKRLDSIGMPWQPDDARWERSFAIAEKYYKEHGNLKPPKDYEVDGVNLSHWIWAQRRMYLKTDTDKGKKLTEEQIRRLEFIGMDWAPKSKGFSYYCEIAKLFYDAYGNTDFPAGAAEVDGKILPESGEALIAWKERVQREFANKKYDMKWEQITSLREIGILPAEKSSPWEKNYQAAEEYYRKNGNLRVPFSYITEDGVRLGRWISTQRMKRNGTAAGKLSEEQIRRLDAIGMVWNAKEKQS